MSVDIITDQDIVNGIKSGGFAREKVLYEIFYKRDWKGAVIKMVLINSGNQQDGEDLAQDTLIILEKNIRLNKFNGDSALKTYFLGIARLQWLNRIRDRKETVELKPIHDSDFKESVEESYINEEKKVYWEKIFNEIGDRCKKIIQMRQAKQSLLEIANAVGLSSANMAKKQAYRCRNKMREVIIANPVWRKMIQ